MLSTKIGYSYNDVTIVPSVISDVSSRSECNPFKEDVLGNIDHLLPIFASPMASVVNFENYEKFSDNGIIPIIPRNIDIAVRADLMDDQQWVALSLKEFEELFIKDYKNRINDFRTHYFVVVDIANGHMKSLYDKCKQAKQLAKYNHYKLSIMTGNIANAETYRWICDNCYIKNDKGQYECCIDFIRVGIGGGSGCITTSNVSIHYPQASLIHECYTIKKALNHADLYEHNPYNCFSKYVNLPKIVADGGIRNYDHVIKALALGADYVMIGSVFAQCIESAGDKSNKNINQKVSLNIPADKYKDFEIDGKGNWWAYYTNEAIKELSKPWKDKVDEWKKHIEEGLFTKDDADYKLTVLKYEDKIKYLKEKKHIGPIDVKFFGMASADGQKAIDGEKKKTAEGITKYLPVKYTLAGWVENMISYLRSAMSYSNCKTLQEFIGKPTLIVNSISEIQAVNK